MDLRRQKAQIHEMLKESGFPGMKVLEFAFEMCIRDRVRRMNIGNRNTDRENFFIRKRLRIAVLIVFFIGIVLTVFRYFEFVSKTVYEESVSHLTEVFHQSNNVLNELTNKNLTYLHMWGEYLQKTSDESEICDYIDKAQDEAGFLYFYRCV